MQSLFPSAFTQVVSSLIHFLGVSLLSHCLSRRIALEHLTSWTAIFHVPWPRLCLLLIFLDSWLFLFTSGVIIFGVGLDSSEGICSAAIYLCIVFYATSKLLIYAFLTERVYIVWTPAACSGRFKSRIYVLSVVTVGLYAVVITMMFFGRIAYFREGDGTCVIGLKTISSIPLLSYDLYINVFLTALFLWPLMQAETMNCRVKRVAKRALLASLVALTTSSANILVLTILKGHELGWLCLGTCSGDVIVNAYVMYWATSPKRRKGTTPTFSSGIVSKDLNIIPEYNAGTSISRIAHRSTIHSKESQRVNPFARPRFEWTFPQTTVEISAGPPPTPEPKPSLFRRFLVWFNEKEKTSEECPKQIQITITTEFGETREILGDDMV